MIRFCIKARAAVSATLREAESHISSLPIPSLESLFGLLRCPDLTHSALRRMAHSSL